MALSDPLPIQAGAPPAAALPGGATLGEIFAVSADGGATGFVLSRIDPARPWLWVQERMAILEGGRLHPPGLGECDLIHVEARDARDALWAMEEGLRCGALGAVIGEIWGDPKAVDFTATRRLAVAAERHGVPALLLRVAAMPNLSGARTRWRVTSATSDAHPFNPRAPGAAAWEAELIRARGHPPGRWRLGGEAGAGAENRGDLVAAAANRALGETRRRA